MSCHRAVNGWAGSASGSLTLNQVAELLLFNPKRKDGRRVWTKTKASRAERTPGGSLEPQASTTTEEIRLKPQTKEL